MRIKYMGLADVRRLESGEDFGGQLGTPLDRDIEWNWENKHIIDTEDFDGVDEEFWTLLLENDDFKDVTGMSRIPTNAAQQTWKAMPKSEANRNTSDTDPSVKDSGTAETDEEAPKAGGPSEAAGPTGAGTTTVGGSTGGGARGGRGGSTRGGSTS